MGKGDALAQGAAKPSYRPIFSAEVGRHFPASRGHSKKDRQTEGWQAKANRSEND